MYKIIKATILLLIDLLKSEVIMNEKELYHDTVKKNYIIYNEEIIEYKKYLQEYADYIRNLNLTDLEIFLKVLKDTWEEVTYGKTDNVIGYYRLSFQEEGKGVCTSFADDFTSKINAINPKYNARNIIVYENKKRKVIDVVPIKRKIVKDITVTKEQIKKEKKYGNHMVTLLQIPEYDLYLVVDPTNLMIGYLKNGQIILLNDEQKNYMNYKIYDSNVITPQNDKELLLQFIKTFNKQNLSHEEIKMYYGYQAQKDAYEKIKNIKCEVKRLIKTEY